MAKSPRNKEWKVMEQTITKLIQEHYRLLGVIVYEPTSDEVDKTLRNRSDDGLGIGWN